MAAVVVREAACLVVATLLDAAVGLGMAVGFATFVEELGFAAGIVVAAALRGAGSGEVSVKVLRFTVLAPAGVGEF